MDREKKIEVVAEKNPEEILVEVEKIFKKYITQGEANLTFLALYTECGKEIEKAETEDKLAMMLQLFGQYLVDLAVAGGYPCSQSEIDQYIEILELTIHSRIDYLTNIDEAQRLMEYKGYKYYQHHPVHVIIIFHPQIPSYMGYLKTVFNFNNDFLLCTSHADIPNIVDVIKISHYLEPARPADAKAYCKPVELAVMMDNTQLLNLFASYNKKDLFLGDPYIIGSLPGYPGYSSIGLSFLLMRMQSIDYFLEKNWEYNEQTILECMAAVFILVNERYSLIVNDLIATIIEKLIFFLEKPLEIKGSQTHIRPFFYLKSEFFLKKRYLNHQLSFMKLCAQRPDLKKSSWLRMWEVYESRVLSDLIRVCEADESKDFSYLTGRSKLDPVTNFVCSYNITSITNYQALDFFLENYNYYKNSILLQKRLEDDCHWSSVSSSYMHNMAYIVQSQLEDKSLYVTLNTIRKRFEFTLAKWILGLSSSRTRADHYALTLLAVREDFMDMFDEQSEDFKNLLRRLLVVVNLTRLDFSYTERQWSVLLGYFISGMIMQTSDKIQDNYHFLNDFATHINYLYGLKDYVDVYVHQLSECPNEMVINYQDFAQFQIGFLIIKFNSYYSRLVGIFNPIRSAREMNNYFNLLLDKKTTIQKFLLDHRLKDRLITFFESLNSSLRSYTRHLNNLEKYSAEMQNLRNFVKISMESIVKYLENVYRFQAKFPQENPRIFIEKEAKKLNDELINFLYTIHIQGTHEVKVHKAAAQNFRWLHDRYGKRLPDSQSEEVILCQIVEYIHLEDKRLTEQKNIQKPRPSLIFLDWLIDTTCAGHLDLRRLESLSGDLAMSYIHGLCLLWLAVLDSDAYVTNFSELHGAKNLEDAQKIVKLAFFDYLVDIHLICHGGKFNRASDEFALYFKGVVASKITLENAISDIPVLAKEIAGQWLKKLKLTDLPQFKERLNSLWAAEDLSPIWPSILPKLKTKLPEIYSELTSHEKIKLDQCLDATSPEDIDFELQATASLSIRTADFIEQCVPQDNNDLFWAAMLAYLLPVTDSADHFKSRCRLIFGIDSEVKTIQDKLSVFNLGHDLRTRWLLIFRKRVVGEVVKLTESKSVEIAEYKTVKDYETIMSVDGTQATSREVLGIAKLLKTKIFYQLNHDFFRFGEEFRDFAPIHIMVTTVSDRLKYKFQLSTETYQRIKNNREGKSEVTVAGNKIFSFDKHYQYQPEQKSFFVNITKELEHSVICYYSWLVEAGQLPFNVKIAPLDKAVSQTDSLRRMGKLLSILEIPFDTLQISKDSSAKFFMRPAENSNWILKNINLLYFLLRIELKMGQSIFVSSRQKACIAKAKEIKAYIYKKPNLPDEEVVKETLVKISQIDCSSSDKKQLYNTCLRLHHYPENALYRLLGGALPSSQSPTQPAHHSSEMKFSSSSRMG